MRGNVDNVRRHLARLREAMTGSSPHAIDEALPELAKAMMIVQKIEQRLANGEAPDRALRATLPVLVREIGLTQQLADRGLALYRNRAMELAALAGGYGATGLPAPLPVGATIRIEG
jgi:hypothetical protein